MEKKKTIVYVLNKTVSEVRPGHYVAAIEDTFPSNEFEVHIMALHGGDTKATSALIRVKVIQNAERVPLKFLSVGYSESDISGIVSKTKEPISMVNFGDKYKGLDHTYGYPAAVLSTQEFRIGIDNSGPWIRETVVKGELTVYRGEKK